MRGTCSRRLQKPARPRGNSSSVHTMVERVGEGGREKSLVSLTNLQYKQRGRTNTVCVLVRAQCYRKMWSVGGVLSFNLGTRMIVFLFILVFAGEWWEHFVLSAYNALVHRVSVGLVSDSVKAHRCPGFFHLCSSWWVWSPEWCSWSSPMTFTFSSYSTTFASFDSHFAVVKIVSAVVCVLCQMEFSDMDAWQKAGCSFSAFYSCIVSEI